MSPRQRRRQRREHGPLRRGRLRPLPVARGRRTLRAARLEAARDRGARARGGEARRRGARRAAAREPQGRGRVPARPRAGTQGRAPPPARIRLLGR